MKTPKAWCFGCGKMRPFTVTAALTPIRQGDKEYIVEQYFARCSKCGKDVYVEKVDDLNFQKMLEAVQSDKRRSAAIDR